MDSGGKKKKKWRIEKKEIWNTQWEILHNEKKEDEIVRKKLRNKITVKFEKKRLENEIKWKQENS